MKTGEYLPVLIKADGEVAQLFRKNYKQSLFQYLIFLFAIGFFAFNYQVAQAAELSFAWDPSDGATGYKLHYGFESRDYSFVVDIGLWTQCTVSGLDNGETYYFAITAYNELGESEYSEEISYMVNLCDNDLDIDGDIDGSDLASLIEELTAASVGDFATRFGIENCEM